MNETRRTLLLRAQSGEADAWKDLMDLYRPLIIGWLNRQGVPAADLEDLSQDVLLSVVKQLPSFEHSGRRGGFAPGFALSSAAAQPITGGPPRDTQATGGSGATAALQQIADPDSDLNRQWDEEHDRYVLGCLLDLVEQESSRAHCWPSGDWPSRRQRRGGGRGTGDVRGGRLRGEVARAAGAFARRRRD